MRLTNYTDYSLRVLIYLAAKDREKLSNIKEIADVYGISKNHLMKVTYELGKMGLLSTTRGRNGGIKLALDPSDINIGQVVRKTEDDFNIVECFDPETNHCVISPVCGLRHVLNKALQSYLQILDGYTLADLVKNQRQLQDLLGTS
ncbi:Rrf2 family transcriptional regulator [Bacillus sp. FJAT-42376]|uniref:RrF2 family transcriptional regulator n=1 Tax=Bacillus sp. FJAT-42376 TaxID=2014076 RepID=UPI000F4FAB39|nr:Rrf2 family transcriptional regulator [Bacillus sp. FJAT-42376]AZB42032.1 Rrf2 family transcriptional regulator [Bacillus sp. FJAT-42376]